MHSLRFPQKDFNPQLEAVVDQYNIVSSQVKKTIAPGGPPVDGIEVNYNGIACMECSYACLQDSTFQKHWSKHHRTLQGKAPQSYTAAVQTLFTVTHRSYFRVDPTLIGDAADSPYAVFLRSFPKLDGLPPRIDTHRDVPPLLQVTDWHYHLSKFMEDADLLSLLQTMKAYPEEKEPIFGLIPSLALAYLKRIQSCNLPLTVRKKIMQGPTLYQATGIP